MSKKNWILDAQLYAVMDAGGNHERLHSLTKNRFPTF